MQAFIRYTTNLYNVLIFLLSGFMVPSHVAAAKMISPAIRAFVLAPSKTGEGCPPYLAEIDFRPYGQNMVKRLHVCKLVFEPRRGIKLDWEWSGMGIHVDV